MAIYTRNSSHTPLPTFREDERDRVVPHSAYDSKDHTNIILSKLKTPSEKTVYSYLASLRGGVHSVTICRVCSLDARAVTFALASLLRQKLILYLGHGLYQCR